MQIMKCLKSLHSTDVEFFFDKVATQAYVIEHLIPVNETFSFKRDVIRKIKP